MKAKPSYKRQCCDPPVSLVVGLLKSILRRPTGNPHGANVIYTVLKTTFLNSLSPEDK
jgi:hypothetical protein